MNIRTTPINTIYKHRVLSCCKYCRNVEIFKVTDNFMSISNWVNVEKCRKCGGACKICILSKYQKLPGFARKCKRCEFKFTCATTKIEKISAILVGISTFEFKVEGNVIPL